MRRDFPDDYDVAWFKTNRRKIMIGFACLLGGASEVTRWIRNRNAEERRSRELSKLLQSAIDKAHSE